MKNLFFRTIKRRHVLASFILITFLTFTALSDAQTKAYRIGPRDVLSLTIYAGGEKQYESDLTVSAQGTINAPFIGTIKAKGLTPSQMEKTIAKPLKKDYFVDPKVNIRIKEYHSLHYYISGAVNKPGLYETTTEATLLELISKAEGALPDRGKIAYIMRSTTNGDDEAEKTGDQASPTPPIKVDLQKLLDKGDMSVNPVLKPGDLIYIPFQKSFDLAESKIYVEGEVKDPGLYDYHPGMTALNACIMAGGFDRFAAPNRTRVIRKKGDGLEVIKINLDKVKDGKIPDVELKPGDRITVPETWL